MIGHLGTRVSALVDGRMPPAEEERAWAHVHACHHCRDQVEREGWVKTRLAGFGLGAAAAPSSLKGTLLSAPAMLPPGESLLIGAGRARSRAAAVAMGSGAVGMAMLGALLVGTSPASAPSLERRAPSTSLDGPRPVTSRSADPVDGFGRDRHRRPATTVTARR